MKYVSIPAKKCLAQRKNFPLPVTLGVFRYTLGYTFSYRHHHKGYAFEALTTLIDLLHARYPQWDFISFTEPENKPSMALLKKLGYKDMGYLPDMESQVFGKWTTPATELEIAQARYRKSVDFSQSQENG